MADIDTSTWSETAASNNAAPADGWPEGQSYASVNNCAREMMGALKRDWNRMHPTIASGGTSTAITLTFTTAPGAYVQGLMFGWRAAADCGAAPTLNVNALGAKTLKRPGPAGLVTLVANDIRTGQLVRCVYDSSADAMIVITPDPRVGWRLVQTQNFAASAALTFACPAVSFSRFKLIISGVNRSAGNGTTLGLQNSTDGGSTYGASYSVSALLPNPVDGASALSSAATAQAVARIFTDFNANNNVDAEVEIISSGDFRIHAFSSGARYNGGSAFYCVQTTANISAAGGTTTHVRVLWSDGGSFLAQGYASLYAYNDGV